MFARSGRLVVTSALASAFVYLAIVRGQSVQPEAASIGLSDFFRPGVVFLDTNEDGAVDFVNARIVLPAHPSAAELAAAADVAARLGFETSAMDLPLDKVPVKPGTAPASRPDGPNAKPAVFVRARAP